MAQEGVKSSIIDRIVDPHFQTLTERAIPPAERIPGTENPCQMLAFDFGVCESATGGLEPQLIEMQGFPTLYAFQAFYPEVLERHFAIPKGFSHYFNGLRGRTNKGKSVFFYQTSKSRILT